MEEIKIIATESLGVRSLCCTVQTENKRIVIDPGIALGYQRKGQFPHPIQIAVDEILKERIITELKDATDVVFSHYHGDHIPLAEANPYQLSLDKVEKYLRKTKVWAKGLENESAKMQKRGQNIKMNVSNFIIAEGESDQSLSFSFPVFHGEKDSNLGSVMMVEVELQNKKFIHASDIQFLHSNTIDQLIKKKPDIVLASGPPLYLSYLNEKLLEKAEENILKLSETVDLVIIDHHLLRSITGLEFLRKLDKKSPNKIMCAADYMGVKPQLLEARREELYDKFPVPADWHLKYEEGKVSTQSYLEKARTELDNFIY